MELPQSAINCSVMLNKDELGFLNSRIRKFAKGKLSFKENSKAVGLPFLVMTYMNLCNRTWSFKLKHWGFHLDNCLDSCISTPLIKFCFCHCKHKDSLPLARLSNYPQIKELFVSDLCLYDIKRLKRLHFSIWKAFVTSMPNLLISISEESLERWGVSPCNPRSTHSSESLHIDYCH